PNTCSDSLLQRCESQGCDSVGVGAYTPNNRANRGDDVDKQRPERGAHVDREKSLEVALAQIEKSFGKGSIMRMGDKEHLQIASIPTGSLAIDLALGIGGGSRGRVVESFCTRSSGNTKI